MTFNRGMGAVTAILVAMMAIVLLSYMGKVGNEFILLGLGAMGLGIYMIAIHWDDIIRGR